jgi:simple sugar transport system ATP-binding protein
MPEGSFLSFRNINKTFPGVVALDKINLDINEGEIHALLGENGAGKSTLMNILYGLYHQDSGDMILAGEKLEHNNPKNAINHGIGMIHQHFMLIPNFSVLENIILGHVSPKPPMLEEKYFRLEIQKVSDKFGIRVSLDALIEDISVGMQQKVEILKALFKGARLLILDEPTSVLTPQESQDLFKMLLELKEKNCTIIFISHKLNEVLQISDRISVLRDGKLVTTVNKRETNATDLSKMMVGREIKNDYNKKACCTGENVLQLEGIGLQDNKGRSLLKQITLNVRAGEIVGIAGVDDNGQMELSEIISGLRKPGSGRITLFGTDVTTATTRQLIEMGMSYIPADRRNVGLVIDFTIAENMILETYYTKPITKGFSLDRKYVSRFAQGLVNEYDVRTPNINVPVRNLSGGNQQKVIISREFSKEHRFLLVLQPTWGLDIGAIEYVHQKLLEERDKGVAILLISTELEEIRRLSDRILVMYEGELAGSATVETSLEEIGLMMAGAKKQIVSR